MKRKTHRQILAELTKRNLHTPEAKAKNVDIEDAIEAAGGSRGRVRDAAA